MYYTLLRLWKTRKINEAALTKAVQYGWITEKQKAAILATPQNKKVS
jgi:hypothetical protein